MTILHLSHTDIKSDSRILKEMLSLSKSNKSYNLIGIGIKRDTGKESDTSSDIIIHSLNIKSLQLNMLPKIIRHIFTLIEFFAKIFFLSVKLKPNVIHCHDILPLPIGVAIKLFTKAKLIYDAHELESEKNGNSKLEKKTILFTEKILWRFIDGLIIVSPSIQKWYTNNIGYKESEIILNSPSIDKEVKNHYSPQYLREKFNIRADNKIFIYVGFLTKGRGIEIFLNIFTKKEISSHIVFLGYGELKDKILDETKKHSNIHMHDAVAHEEVVNLVKSADVGLCFIENVSLSDYYCLPNKLFEYCFSGLPVLASSFPDITEVVDKYDLGKCSKNDEISIYKTINEFENLTKIQRIDTSKLYDLSWQAQEEKLIVFYKNITKEN